MCTYPELPKLAPAKLSMIFMMQMERMGRARHHMMTLIQIHAYENCVNSLIKGGCCRMKFDD